jgi:hypothetical protein
MLFDGADADFLSCDGRVAKTAQASVWMLGEGRRPRVNCSWNHIGSRFPVGRKSTSMKPMS